MVKALCRYKTNLEMYNAVSTSFQDDSVFEPVVEEQMVSLIPRRYICAFEDRLASYYYQKPDERVTVFQFLKCAEKRYPEFTIPRLMELWAGDKIEFNELKKEFLQFYS